MKLITEYMGTPEPVEAWEFQCLASSPRLERYGNQSMLCTRPENHTGPHMAAFESEAETYLFNAGIDVVGPVWTD